MHAGNVDNSAMAERSFSWVMSWISLIFDCKFKYFQKNLLIMLPFSLALSKDKSQIGGVLLRAPCLDHSPRLKQHILTVHTLLISLQNATNYLWTRYFFSDGNGYIRKLVCISIQLNVVFLKTWFLKLVFYIYFLFVLIY